MNSVWSTECFNNTIPTGQANVLRHSKYTLALLGPGLGRPFGVLLSRNLGNYPPPPPRASAKILHTTPSFTPVFSQFGGRQGTVFRCLSVICCLGWVQCTTLNYEINIIFSILKPRASWRIPDKIRSYVNPRCEYSLFLVGWPRN